MCDVFCAGAGLRLLAGLSFVYKNKMRNGRAQARPISLDLLLLSGFKDPIERSFSRSAKLREATCQHLFADRFFCGNRAQRWTVLR